MSTNYYLQAKPRVWDGELVGKTFGGYKPLLHAQDGLSSLDDLRRICDEGYEIVDNAGETYSFFQFREALELCRYRSERFPETNAHDIQEWIDDDGNCWTTREFS